MRSKKSKIILIVIVLAVLAIFINYKLKPATTGAEVTKEIKPFMGAIKNLVSTTGTVLPKNRLEIKPPVNGRVESILVREGEKVKTGQTLAWMSSTERAALLDSARGQGEKTLEYWKQVYKAIPLISPIDGEAIVSKTQPGQTVTTADAVIVLSDQLIVRAQVDETDIGKIRLGQEAIVILDAYPDEKIKAKVDHIYYESKTVNNVTIYEADLLPEDAPQFFRSGMNASVNFIENSKENIMLIPSDAVLTETSGTYVLVKESGNRGFIKRPVELGISDDKNTEVVSGLSLDDILIIKSKKYELPKNNAGTNPFMPSRARGR